MQTGSPVRSRVPGLPGVGRDMLQNVKQFLKCPPKHMTLYRERKLCGYLRPTSTREEPLTRDYSEKFSHNIRSRNNNRKQDWPRRPVVNANAPINVPWQTAREQNSRSPFQTRLSFTSCPEILFRECGAGGAPVSPGGQPPRHRTGLGKTQISPGNCSKTSPGSI